MQPKNKEEAGVTESGQTTRQSFWQSPKFPLFALIIIILVILISGRVIWKNKFSNSIPPTTTYFVCPDGSHHGPGVPSEGVQRWCREHGYIKTNRQIVVITDETEYMMGKHVNIIFKNNSLTKKRIYSPFYTVQKYTGSSWEDLKRVICPCGIFCKMSSYWEIEPGESLDETWDQKESWCKEGMSTISEATISKQVPSGRYRIKSRFGEDGKETQRETIYSNEFEIEGNLVKEITFKKTFGGKNDDYGGSIIQAGDGSYIITGQKNYLDCLLMKIDSNGNSEWEKTFGDDNYRYLGNSVLRTSNGGYIVAGKGSFITAAAGDAHSRVLVIKTDLSGNEEWRKLFENTSPWNAGGPIIQDLDGGYIIGSRQGDFNLIKTDSTGNLEWGKDFSYGGFSSFIQLSEGDYVLIGTNWHYPGGKHSNARLVKVSSDGSKEWEKVFSATGGNSVIQSRDDGYVLMGSIACGDNDGGMGQEIWLAKTDKNGNKEWEKTYSVYDFNQGRSLAQSLDGGYIIVGYTRSFDMEKHDAVLIKVDNKGNEEWKRTFGGDEEDVFNSAIQTADGGYVVLGTKEPFGSGKSDIWLIKTDSQGRVYK